MRRKSRDTILADEAGASARGLGSSGGAADATRRTGLQTLWAEGQMWIRVETEAHRSEGFVWTGQERRRFLEGLDRFFLNRGRKIAEEAKAAWTRRGITFSEAMTSQILRQAQVMHGRLRPEAEEAIAASERDIRADRRTRGMFRLAFASALVTGAGTLVQSAPTIRSWFGDPSPIARIESACDGPGGQARSPLSAPAGVSPSAETSPASAAASSAPTSQPNLAPPVELPTS